MMSGLNYEDEGSSAMSTKEYCKLKIIGRTFVTPALVMLWATTNRAMIQYWGCLSASRTWEGLNFWQRNVKVRTRATDE